MSDQTEAARKPRLWLRLLVVIVLLAVLAASLAGVKFLQIQDQIAQASQPPPPTSVTVATAEAANWRKRIKAIGTLVAFQGVDVTTEISGVITSINFDSGNEIEAGNLLVEFDNRTEMANLESARARFESDDSQYQRLLKLKDQSFVTKNDIDTQASLVDIAEAEVRVAKVALAKKRIYAPFRGRLGIRQVDLGQYVAPGSTIVTLLSLDKLYLDFTLPESNFKDLVSDQSIAFNVRSYPDQQFRARVETWNPQLDANTRNISIRAVVDNRKRLLAPGMFADMNVQSRRRQAVMTVPETAIFYNIYGEAVYILEAQEDNAGSESAVLQQNEESVDDAAVLKNSDSATEPEYRLAARQVDVAYRNNGMAGIKSGLNEGDIVVTAGQLKLYPSLRVAIVKDVLEFQNDPQ